MLLSGASGSGALERHWLNEIPESKWIPGFLHFLHKDMLHMKDSSVQNSHIVV